MDRGYRAWGCKESDTNERLSTCMLNLQVWMRNQTQKRENSKSQGKHITGESVNQKKIFIDCEDLNGQIIIYSIYLATVLRNYLQTFNSHGGKQDSYDAAKKKKKIEDAIGNKDTKL